MPETAAAPAVSSIEQIPVDQIKPSRHQARKDFDEEGIKQLAASIEKEDLLQPITVRKVGEAYELIAGERRLRAVKSLDRPTIEARIIEVASEAAACAKGLVENLQRKDLNPIEEAEGFQELNSLDPAYWTHDEIAKVAGRSRVYITQSLGFLKLPDAIQDYVRRLTLNRSQLIEIMRLPTPDAQVQAAEKAKDLSWKETRQLVDELLKPKNKSAADQAPDPKATITFTAGGPDIKFSGQAPKGVSIEGLVDLFREKIYAWMGVAEPKENPAVEAVLASDVSAPSAPSDSSPRIPKTPEERAELEALAAQSPHAVYEWIFGPESFLAKRMATVTWQSMGIADPKAGLKQLLEGIQVVEASKAGRKKHE